MIQFPVILALAVTLAFAPEKTAPVDDAPTISINTYTLPPRLTATLPDGILRAEQAGIINLDYSPGDEKTYYFDAGGAPVNKATI